MEIISRERGEEKRESLRERGERKRGAERAKKREGGRREDAIVATCWPLLTLLRK